MADAGQRIGDQAYVKVEFSPDPGFELVFDGLEGEEELGRPFLFHVDLSGGAPHSDLWTLVGGSATVCMKQSTAGAPERFIDGVVTRVVSAGLTGGAYRYRIELRPWVWLLCRITDCRIFQSQTAFDIVTAVFREAGFSDVQDRRRNGAGDIELDYCVQYRETSLDFVTRLMEQFGLYYFFTHERGRHTLVFADDPGAHPEVDGAVPFRFDQTEYRTVADHLWAWSSNLTLESGKFTFRDFNFTTPAADLTAKTVQAGQHRHGTFEVYEYPGRYDTQDTGARLTDVRMQAISGRRAVFEGSSNARALRAGWKFTLSQHAERALNRDYLIVRAQISIALGESTGRAGGETNDTYRVTLQAIPADAPFRLERSTRRPMIRGPQTAMVVGRAGDEITTDQYGRVKLRFHWDRSGTQDDRRSCWVRVSQAWAGRSFGGQFVPRIGHEVVVEFLEGNPDRPLVTGAVYNATATVPHSLPDNKTRTAFKTNSSPGGGGGNELRFEDSAGGEEMLLHASKDFTLSVKHDSKTTVAEGDHTVTVTQGRHALTVSAGDHTVTVSSGRSTTTAAQSITLQVGGNSIVVDAAGVKINGATVTVQGQSALSLSAPQIALN